MVGLLSLFLLPLWIGRQRFVNTAGLIVVFFCLLSSGISTSIGASPEGGASGVSTTRGAPPEVGTAGISTSMGAAPGRIGLLLVFMGVLADAGENDGESVPPSFDMMLSAALKILSSNALYLCWSSETKSAFLSLGLPNISYLCFLLLVFSQVLARTLLGDTLDTEYPRVVFRVMVL